MLLADLEILITYISLDVAKLVVNKYDTGTNTESQYILPRYIDWTELKDFRTEAIYVNSDDMISFIQMLEVYASCMYHRIEALLQ